MHGFFGFRIILLILTFNVPFDLPSFFSELFPERLRKIAPPNVMIILKNSCMEHCILIPTATMIPANLVHE